MAYNPKKYRKFVATAATATLVAQAIAPIASAAVTNVKDFTDVSERYQEAVQFLLDKEATSGKTETTFGISENITRQDAAVLLVKVLGLEVDKTITSTKFTDISARTAPYVQALLDAGITNGKTETTFGASEEIKRVELAVWIAQGFELEGSGEIPFTDVASRYVDSVSALYDNQVAFGKTETQFGAEQQAVRGEFALFLYRAAHVETEKPEEKPEFTITSNELEVDNLEDFNTLFAGNVELPENVTITDVDFASSNEAVIKDADTTDEQGLVASTQNGETSIYVDTITVLDNKGTATEEDDETYVLTLGETFNVSVNIVENIYDEFTRVENAQDAQNTVAEGGVTVFGSDIVVEKEQLGSNGYGATGIQQHNGGIIDGNGKTFSVEGANGTWDSAISTKGGTIKNLTINSGFRGIFIGGAKSDVIVDNVILDGTVYTISCDDGGDKKLIVSNSTLNGWTSYAGTLSEAAFTNCKFGESNGYAFMRPYASTTLTNCEFSEGFKLDSTQTHKASKTITLKNCTVGGTLVTEENVTTLLGADAQYVTIEKEEKIATAKAHFYQGHTQVDITLKEDINLGLLSSKGNIVVKFMDANGKAIKTKNKSWAGYLNDSQGNKYGKGTNLPSNNYSNQLVAGNTYTTTLNEDNVVKVEVTVTTDNNEVKTIELTK